MKPIGEIKHLPSTPMYNPELLGHYMSIVFIGDHAERCVLVDVRDNLDSLTFRFIPSDFLRYKYDIRKDDFDNKIELLMEKSYPKSMCRLVKDKNVRLTFWVIFQTYDGRDIVMGEIK